MLSFHLLSSISPSCANIHNPKNTTEINCLSIHSSTSCDDPFSAALHSLRTCIEKGESKLGSSLHARIIKLGIENDVFISNSLLQMYSKCDQIRHVENMFDHMPHRTIVSWTSIISAYCHSGLAEESIMLFCRMLEFVQPNEFTLAVVLQACAQTGDESLVKVIQNYAIKSGLISDGFLQNSLIDAYAKMGMLGAAERLLQRLCSRDVVSWTSVISGCMCNGNAEKALSLFFNMQKDGVLPNEVTMLSILQSCSEIGNWKIMQWIHGLVLKGNWCASGMVMNSLIQMYSTNGFCRESTEIFSHFSFDGEGLYPSSETIANLLHGCGNSGLIKLGQEIHGYLVKHGFLPCTVAENSLMNMYAENGSKDSALHLFKKMTKKDIISWNTIIRCFVKNEKPVDALRFLSEIHRVGALDNVSPDFVTFLVSFQACSDLALLPHGQVIHGYVTRTGLISDIFVHNALIDMYAKAGRADFAEKIFMEMPERDLGSWNSIIAAYGINGNGTSAIEMFADLENSLTLKPNTVTFTNVLAACAHTGLVKEGLQIFESMMRDYGLKPSMEHFGCLVDLLGRAGKLEEAETFITMMPIKPGPDVWGALLNAGVLFSDIKRADKAAKMLSNLQPTNSTWRVALSNAYAAVEKWHDAANIRAELRGSKQLKKERGWSSVNVDGHEISFVAGDTKHLESEFIYEIIIGLQNHMQDAGLYI